MEAADREKARGSRLVLLIALTVLAATSALGFSRVFQGHDTAVRFVLAAVIATLLAGALERQHIAIAALASAVGLAIAIGLLVFPDTTKYLLPTPTTWRAALAAFHGVGHAAQVQVAPALPLPPLMLAGVTATWTAAFAAHSLAVRARSPFLALLPLASLLAFAGILLEDGARPAYVISFLAGSLGLLFADGFRRVGHWGPVSVWHGRSRFGVGSATTTRSARRLAYACLGIAAFFPWVLPGFKAGAILDVHGGQASKFVSIDPIVDIRPALLNTTPIPLFVVRSDRAAYWRFLSLDVFDGRLWKASNLQATDGPLVANGPVSHDTPSVQNAKSVSYLHQRFVFDRLTQPWLPAAYDPVAVTLQGLVARYDARSQVLFAPNGTFKGFTYDVESRLVVPTPEELDAEPLATGPDVAPFTALPADMPKQIIDIAHRLTDREPTTYGKIIAIQRYLRDFKYDIRAKPGHGVNDILYFLTNSKTGYCEQFSGSMAVLLRALHIPARVAVGFTPGILDPRVGGYRVTTQNAHAWVEAYFPDFGWLAFEPTPTRSNPVANSYVIPPVPAGGRAGCSSLDPAQCGSNNGGGFTPGPKPGENINPKRPRIGRGEDNPITGPNAGNPLDFAPAQPPPPDRWRTLVLEGLLALGVLIVLLIPVAKWGSRRSILMRARSPKDRVLATFDVMSQRAADVGLGRRQDETLGEYQARLRQRVPALDGSFDKLTELTSRAAYSEEGVERDQAERASTWSRAVVREIRKATSVGSRVIGLFRLERFALPR
jgi:transglutaminase-like putative cysteine protease